MSLSPVKFISVKQGEGLIADVGIERGASTFADANLALYRICRNCDRKMPGYLKTDVIVTWENGEAYKLRFDATYDLAFKCNIAGEIRQDMEFHTGKWRPPHMAEEDYRKYLREEDPRLARKAQRILDTCSLSDKEVNHGLDVHA